MQVGSLVENTKNIDTGDYVDHWFKSKGGIYPVKGSIYTVRAIVPGPNGIGILLEEIINPAMPLSTGIKEPAFLDKFFSELQPPLEIQLSDLLPEEITA